MLCQESLLVHEVDSFTGAVAILVFYASTFSCLHTLIALM